VLDIASLIMVTLPTVSSFFSACGCFLRDGRSPSGDLPPLSLACVWPPGANGSLPFQWRCLQGFRVEDPSGARKGGPNRHWKWARPVGPSARKGGPNWHWKWARPASLGRPAQAHPGPARSPLRARGSSGDYVLCPPPFA
jgi:hypothetical protein